MAHKGPSRGTCKRCGARHWQEGKYCLQCQTSLDKGDWAEIEATEEDPLTLEAVMNAVRPQRPVRDVYKLITYPFPMSNGVMAYLNLPEDISPEDIDRLCEMLRTLPYEEVTPKGTAVPQIVVEEAYWVPE